jgi:hypothetical protein
MFLPLPDYSFPVTRSAVKVRPVAPLTKRKQRVHKYYFHGTETQKIISLPETTDNGEENQSANMETMASSSPRYRFNRITEKAKKERLILIKTPVLVISFLQSKSAVS